ncbi:hypothetical protein N7457_004726 [Penicillium paradoxum]|uniref:uncharacterized protein n=1 Tax=Penicillium paradoxum TaxID=176176 RepID=UPI002549952D|nr:uncharacterized protein N7457_004726 [Penicillium paradoxum]KAJ5782952.1 hypothetical protein N7457_004726 [Penicillium paradoxum]
MGVRRNTGYAHVPPDVKHYYYDDENNDNDDDDLVWSGTRVKYHDSSASAQSEAGMAQMLGRI